MANGGGLEIHRLFLCGGPHRSSSCPRRGGLRRAACRTVRPRLPQCTCAAEHDGMMAVETFPEHIEIKVVGKSGQISLGKSYAGKPLRLERRQDGTMVLTAVAVVPESQLWTLEEPHRS